MRHTDSGTVRTAARDLGGAAAADRIYQLLDRKPTVVNPRSPVPLPRHARDLVFENVAFRYTPDQPVLEGVSLTIRAGETIAIVGPNGCGKSTLAKIWHATMRPAMCFCFPA